MAPGSRSAAMGSGPRARASSPPGTIWRGVRPNRAMADAAPTVSATARREPISSRCMARRTARQSSSSSPKRRSVPATSTNRPSGGSRATSGEKRAMSHCPRAWSARRSRSSESSSTQGSPWRARTWGSISAWASARESPRRTPRRAASLQRAATRDRPLLERASRIQEVLGAPGRRAARRRRRWARSMDRERRWMASTRLMGLARSSGVRPSSWAVLPRSIHAPPCRGRCGRPLAGASPPLVCGSEGEDLAPVELLGSLGAQEGRAPGRAVAGALPPADPPAGGGGRDLAFLSRWPRE